MIYEFNHVTPEEPAGKSLHTPRGRIPDRLRQYRSTRAPRTPRGSRTGAGLSRAHRTARTPTRPAPRLRHCCACLRVAPPCRFSLLSLPPCQFPQARVAARGVPGSCGYCVRVCLSALCKRVSAAECGCCYYTVPLISCLCVRVCSCVCMCVFVYVCLYGTVRDGVCISFHFFHPVI